jgi:hypothetical protein
MTSITFGGGPTIEARRDFSNLKEGSQVPGYLGYIHQLKYNNGHTYGDQTHLLAHKFPTFNRAKSEINLSQSAAPFIRNQLPKTNGGNRLTEQMVPGYTGYIPSRKFHFSDTYKVESDICIDDFLTNKREKLNKDDSLINNVLSQSKHIKITDNSDVKRSLDNYKDVSIRNTSLKNDKREFTEPPIPGYTGHIPRIFPTELGLGARYNQTTAKGLAEFKSNYLRQTTNFEPSRERLSDDFPSLNQSFESTPKAKKIYVKPGMIPKYTGYVHGRKFQFGNTYGNTTRKTFFYFIKI